MTEVPALTRAVRNLGGTLTEHATATLYEGRQSFTGTVIQLPGWKYPIVLTADGQLHFDDYGGRWGKITDLRRLEVRYGVQVALLDAEEMGQQATEYETADEVVVEIEV